MKFDNLRKLEERFTIAGEDVDALIEALAKDIALNKDITAPEMKFQIQGSLATQATVNRLTAMAAEMAYRLADDKMQTVTEAWKEELDGQATG